MTKEVLLTLQGLQFDQREENAETSEEVPSEEGPSAEE